MRFNAALTSALVSSASIMGMAHADETEKKPETTSIAEKPTFTPTTLKAPFLEQFTDDWDSRWTPSHAKKEDSKSEEDWAYVGEWSVEEPTVLKGIEGDKGLVVKNVAAHHAISSKFPKKIDNKDKTLVVQYEVKPQNSLVCGGAYLKLLQDNKKLQSEEFSNASPYVIMFGPDKCGATNKVHFIFRHKNPKTGEYEEKHLKAPPAARTNKVTSLYTLIVRPDQTFSILIDGEEAKSGNLLEDFSPAVNPEKEIDDPKDKKPSDWVDESKIADPEATKPEDWDEDAPYEIVDEDAEKPEDWLEDEPTSIPDPEAEKPEDWDDEEDGDWVPPTVPNPKCQEAAGCGPWTAPLIKNPAYKGKWTAPLVDNPAYKGPWAPRKIANPAYFEDKTPSNFEPMGAIGFEIWTMQNDILFDNIYIGHSEEDAEQLRKETFDIKHPIELAEEEANKPKPEEQIVEPSVSFKENPVAHVREKVDRFVGLAKQDPIAAVKQVPDVAGGLAAVLVTMVLLIVGAVGASSPAAAPVKKGKEAASAAKEKAAEAVSSATNTGKGGATKRQTRSSAE
ncbi:calnexin [Aspergillus brunneoviolaceus CBS 621.78]|uniref:Calnexin n=2 Tax=Aspergillus TaxID=5052 RepID=A0A8G1VWI1_9EURO|nr:calnexin precursor [Aspergillus brunneoviolaceus CBS 621.78]XP_040798231.1 calnexin precursor [Aspergillus fijiensis CBS 313.89]RAH45170.1 calnexin precursor [Aspergillus brunneoviolaceus CBS 621.78]RAK74221.1 calnexin precursor [Aspergillus fijiensis CBS 313.89]